MKKLSRLCLSMLVLLVGCAFSFAASATVTEESLKDTHFQIDWKPTAGSYWNSTSSQKINTANTPFNNQFMASGIRFTKDMLPVGSYIFVDSGYRYRPEGWQNETDKNSNTRPGNVTTSCVEVTEAWWSNYTIRAFQIQNYESDKNYTGSDGSSYTYDLRANFDEAKNKLRIYVPNGTTGVDPYVELIKLDLELTSGFYSSEGKSYEINTGTDLAKQFWATVIFTRETLPVGSVIEVDSGYKYRPEGWTQLGVATSPRPANVSTKKVTVTEEWWGDFNYRAFNISTNPQTDITNRLSDIKSHFRIYVPATAAPPAFEWTVGYWDSASGTARSTSGDLAKCFVSSQMFTKETLPVGSVITIDSGYKYRPDGWIDLNTKNTHSSKPGNVSTASVTVTEDWWGDWTYRGFNISTNAQGDISENYLEVASHFNITLPDGRKYVHPKNEEEEPEPPSEPEEPVNPVAIPEAEEGVVRILSIGNSYSNDAQAYTHKIAESLGIKAEFFNLYYGGCTIEQHYNFYNNDSANYIFYRNMTKYVSGNVTIKNVLEAAQFDIITFQQGSYSSDKYSNYSKLDDLMAIVRSYQPNAEFMIHQTWSYCEERSLQKGYSTSAEMLTKVKECYAQAAADNGNLGILRSGEAVQMAKDEYCFTSDYGNTNSIYSDFNSHLAPRGDYLAGCVWIETLFDIDTRNATFDGGFSDAVLLREIAHRIVNGTDGAKIGLGESKIFNKAPIIRTLSADGYDYDGRMKVTVYNASDSSEFRTYMQNSDGSLEISGLPEGRYFFKAEKNGYAAYTSDVFDVARDSTTDFEEFDMNPGDIKESTQDFCGDGIIDINDFIRVLKGFNPNATNELRTIVDINCDGIVNVDDLSLLKNSIKK